MEKSLPIIIVISLINSPRREYIEDRLNGLGLRFQFFDAVYGKSLSDNELSKVDYEYYPKYYSASKPLTLGEIGCAMSHIKVYEYMVENNIEEAIILEDDAVVSLYIKEILSAALEKVSDKKEILFLDHGKAKVYPFMKNLPERYRLAKYRKPSRNSKRTIIRTTGYLLTLKGAQKLLQHAYPIRMPSDYLTGLIQLTGINAYGIEPACVFGSNVSEIDQIQDRYK